MILACGCSRQRGSVDCHVGMTNIWLLNDKITTRHGAHLSFFHLQTTSSYEFHMKRNKITQQQHSFLLHMCMHAHQLLLLLESLCVQLKGKGKNYTSCFLSNPLSGDMLDLLVLNMPDIIVLSGATN